MQVNGLRDLERFGRNRLRDHVLSTTATPKACW